MRKKLISCLMAILLCAAAVFPASLHSGRTDAQGGHTNRSTGEYHYHHGYSAHSHPGGVCPYSTPAATPAPTSKDSGVSEETWAAHKEKRKQQSEQQAAINARAAAATPRPTAAPSAKPAATTEQNGAIPYVLIALAAIAVVAIAAKLITVYRRKS